MIATIPGTVEPDRWVMVGNHRDAWVYGAVDPGSGTAATLEMCSALGSAVKNGWKPRRTIVYASWDAEEYGLVGSTEWAEEHAKEVDEKAVLMLNVDSAVSGRELEMSGVPSLRDLTLEAAAAITDVRTGKSLDDLWTTSAGRPGPPHAAGARRPALGQAGLDKRRHRAAGDSARFIPQMGWLGSGSDYTAFVDHLGVPVVDAGFKGGYGVYHSIYDDFNWMDKFGDPEFLTHATAARLYTLIVMRAAAADVVPLKFKPYGVALARARRRAAPDQGSARAARAEERSPGLDRIRGVTQPGRGGPRVSSQAEQLDRATEKAAAFEQRRRGKLAEAQRRPREGGASFPARRRAPGRPWFKHAIYAPGLTTGYACWPLPASTRISKRKRLALAADVALTVERIKAGDRKRLEAAAARDQRRSSQLKADDSIVAPNVGTWSRLDEPSRSRCFGTRDAAARPGPGRRVLRGGRVHDRLGIFLVPAKIAQDVPFICGIILVWVFGGIFSGGGALTLAELGAMMPQAGGLYVYLRAAYGPLLAFLFGWVEFLVVRSGSMATLAAAFARYFVADLPASRVDPRRSGKRARPCWPSRR